MGNQNVDRSELVDFTNGRKIYPEVAEYLGSRFAAARAYEDATKNANRVYEDAETVLRRKAEDEGRQYDMYEGDEAASRAARSARDEAYAAARRARRDTSQALLTNSPHREVKWIAEHCLFANQGSEIEGYALDILKILPATVEEIWDEAKDNRGMCDVFDRFFDQAEAAGIFTDSEVPDWYRSMAAVRSYIRRNYGGNYIRDLQPQINRVIKAVEASVTTKYEVQLSAAKAEWQRLDEAYAEQTHRNRSEGARRAAETRARNRSIISTQSAMTGEIIRSEIQEDVSV